MGERVGITLGGEIGRPRFVLGVGGAVGKSSLLTRMEGVGGIDIAYGSLATESGVMTMAIGGEALLSGDFCSSGFFIEKGLAVTAMFGYTF